MRRATFLAVTLLVSAACHREATTSDQVSVSHPSILFVTLDTTRADAIGPEQHNVDTPSFNALAKRGMRFRYAYATVPQTLPSHTSMLTGLYPAGHGVHENSRRLDDTQPIVAERLHAAGYRTAAFVSAFALARRFGLARGFDVYDEDFGPGNAERTAKQTTDRVLAWLAQASDRPTFLWVHYYDPHFPYTPPEPYRTRYAKQPYFGEIASMDEQLGRLVAAFEQHAKQPITIIITGDHGEGLGDHGEAQHGNLMYQATMHVPLLVIGPGVSAGTSDAPVSTRRIFHTILDFAGIDATNTLRQRDHEVVVAEAMKPFLDYGWQPQVMAVEGSQKTILAGKTEVYDVVADPAETHDLAATAPMSRPVRTALREYPIPSPAQQTTTNLDDEARRKLASLGYVASTVAPVVRKDAPRPADMAPLFPILDEAAALFVREEYAKDIPLLQKILAKDPYNLDSALRLATAYSSLGREKQAVDAFKEAQQIAPDSPDVRAYLALHLARGEEWPKAVPMLEDIVAKEPDRVPPLEALAVIRERQGRFEDALALRQKISTLRTPAAAESVHMGELAMRVGATSVAIESFEHARNAQGAAFKQNLELGVLYLAAGRLTNARDALDRVPPSHPGYAMALFKRAQVSVLLHEADAQARIDSAQQHATPVTRELIARERLFR
jgi:choline-sulfatase